MKIHSRILALVLALSGSIAYSMDNQSLDTVLQNKLTEFLALENPTPINIKKAWQSIVTQINDAIKTTLTAGEIESIIQTLDAIIKSSSEKFSAVTIKLKSYNLWTTTKPEMLLTYGDDNKLSADGVFNDLKERIQNLKIEAAQQADPNAEQKTTTTESPSKSFFDTFYIIAEEMTESICSYLLKTEIPTTPVVENTEEVTEEDYNYPLCELTHEEPNYYGLMTTLVAAGFLIYDATQGFTWTTQGIQYLQSLSSTAANSSFALYVQNLISNSTATATNITAGLSNLTNATEVVGLNMTDATNITAAVGQNMTDATNITAAVGNITNATEVVAPVIKALGNITNATEVVGLNMTDATNITAAVGNITIATATNITKAVGQNMTDATNITAALQRQELTTGQALLYMLTGYKPE